MVVEIWCISIFYMAFNVEDIETIFMVYVHHCAFTFVEQTIANVKLVHGIRTNPDSEIHA